MSDTEVPVISPKKRGRPPLQKTPLEPANLNSSISELDDSVVVPSPKRGRPPKQVAAAAAKNPSSAESPKRGRGRPPKNGVSPAAKKIAPVAARNNKSTGSEDEVRTID